MNLWEFWFSVVQFDTLSSSSLLIISSDGHLQVFDEVFDQVFDQVPAAESVWKVLFTLCVYVCENGGRAGTSVTKSRTVGTKHRTTGRSAQQAGSDHSWTVSPQAQLLTNTFTTFTEMLIIQQCCFVNFDLHVYLFTVLDFYLQGLKEGMFDRQLCWKWVKAVHNVLVLINYQYFIDEHNVWVTVGFRHRVRQTLTTDMKWIKLELAESAGCFTLATPDSSLVKKWFSQNKQKCSIWQTSITVCHNIIDII